jgi:hypothetical protein
MPNKPIPSNMTVVVTNFHAYMSFGISYEAQARKPDPDSAAYDVQSYLELIAELIEPEVQWGYQLKLWVIGYQLIAQGLAAASKNYRSGLNRLGLNIHSLIK